MRQFNNGYYRGYFKSRYHLDKHAISNVRILAFNIREDLLNIQNSSFTVETVPSNVKEGDVLIVIDPCGTTLYTGVIKTIEEQSIDCKDILTLFDDTDLYHIGSYKHVNCHTRTRYILNHYRNTNSYDSKITSLIDQFTFEESDDYDRGWTFDYTEVHDKNVCDLLLLQYERYNSKITIQVFIDGKRPIIHTGHVRSEKINLLDNTIVLPSMEPIIETQETNKLVIYSEDYSQLRGYYFLTENGVTNDPSDLLRTNVINTKMVSSDESLESIVNSELGSSLYSHQLKVSMLLENRLYNYFDFKLGGYFMVMIKRNIFDTIYTAYEIDFPLGSQKCELVNLTFGKVRKRASERFFK